MKTILTMTILSLSLNSFALSESSNWSQIRAAVKSDKNLEIENDTAYLGRTISIFNTCIQGSNLVSTVQYPFYDLVDTNGGDEFEEVYAGHETLVFPITHTDTTEVCESDDRRCEYVEYSVTEPTSKQLVVKKFVKTVRDGSDDERNIYQTLFTKEYSIPNCN